MAVAKLALQQWRHSLQLTWQNRNSHFRTSEKPVTYLLARPIRRGQLMQHADKGQPNMGSTTLQHEKAQH
jgi:hypothetical protein